MNLWQKMKDLLIVNDTIMDKTFSLGERYGDQEEPGDQDSQRQTKGEKVEQAKGNFRKPLKTGEIQKRNQAKEESKSGQFDEEVDLQELKLSNNIKENKAVIKKVFRMPLNKDFVIRDFIISLDEEVEAFLIYTEGMSSRDAINFAVLEPLMHLSRIDHKEVKDHIELVYKELLPSNQVEKKYKLKELVEGVLSGQTALFVAGFEGGFLLETRGMPSRGVSSPISEASVQGPQEAFTEHFRTNTALIRKRLRSERLITEMTKVGEINKADVAIFYMQGIVNPKLVKEVKRRIAAIKVDNVTDIGVLGELIGDSPYSIIPKNISTERPDRVCAFLIEGHVAVILDGNPFVLVVPITFWSLLHTSEDYSLGFPFGVLLRIVRVAAFFVALLTPALYIAISNYHPEMIPTDLLLAAAAARETVPFPAIVEVLLMELSFELIREAGTRTPSIIGNTIGIVGALILGQAAVEANIVSPLLVIVVALTALGSFAIPSYALSFGVRLARFLFIIAASFLGFYGMAIGLFIFTIHLCNTKIFGVPIMSPVAPFRPPSRDIVIRYPYWKFNTRPGYLRTKDGVRQKPITRTWDPGTKRLQAMGPEEIPGFANKNANKIKQSKVPDGREKS